MAPLLPETWVASVSSDSVVDETLEVDCCGYVGFTLLHSDLSLPTSFPSWLFLGVDIESSPFTDSSNIWSVRQCMFLKKSSDILGWLVMNEDLYDTGSAVVGLYRLFYQLFEIPWGIPRTGLIHLGVGGGVLGITGPSPSYSSFFILLSIKTIWDHQQLYLKLGKNIW